MSDGPEVYEVSSVVVVNSRATEEEADVVSSETRSQALGVATERATPAIGSQFVQASVLDVSSFDGATLPRTGVNTGLLLVVSGLLLAVGTVLTLHGRPPSPAGRSRR